MKKFRIHWDWFSFGSEEDLIPLFSKYWDLVREEDWTYYREGFHGLGCSFGRYLRKVCQNSPFFYEFRGEFFSHFDEEIFFVLLAGRKIKPAWLHIDIDFLEDLASEEKKIPMFRDSRIYWENKEGCDGWTGFVAGLGDFKVTFYQKQIQRARKKIASYPDVVWRLELKGSGDWLKRQKIDPFVHEAFFSKFSGWISEDSWFQPYLSGNSYIKSSRVVRTREWYNIQIDRLEREIKRLEQERLSLVKFARIMSYLPQRELIEKE